MENTTENKAKFFALYWGQKIQKYNNTTDPTDTAYEINTNFTMALSEAYLELKSLESITDEDAKELSLRLGMVVDINKKIMKNSSDLVKEIIDNYSRINSLHLLPSMFADKVRELGYAWPYDDLQIEEQINRGWVKIKSEQL